MNKNNFKINQYIVTVCVLYILGCGKEASEFELLNKPNPKGVYGNSLSNGITRDVTQLLKNPDKYLNEDILATGVVKEVCPMRGCWIQISDDSTAGNIRVKVTDGEIVFPKSAKNHSVTVQGTFIRLDLSKDQAINWKVHLEAEKGIELNPNDVVLEEEDYFEYRINCAGAVIL